MAAGSAPEPRRFGHFSEIAGFIWQVADLLRGDYKQADYGKVILPFTVLRRLDCVLEPTKAKVLARREQLKGSDLKSQDVVLNKVAGVPLVTAGGAAVLPPPVRVQEPSRGQAAQPPALVAGPQAAAPGVAAQRAGAP